MATKFRADVTQDIPIQVASTAALERASQVQGQMAQDVGRANIAMAEMIGKATTSLYDVYKKGEQENIRKQVASETEAFVTSRKQASLATQKLKEIGPTDEDYFVQQSQRMQAEGVSAEQISNDVKTFASQVSKLKQASEGGMSASQYVTRIQAITKEAIAKNPSQADTIRGIVATETGMNKTDVDANLAYLQDVFNPKTPKASPLDTDKMVADTIEDMVTVLPNTDKLKLSTMYKTDPAAFEQQRKIYVELKNIQLTRAEEEAKLKAITTADTTVVRQAIPSVVNMFSTDVGFALAKETMLENSAMYKMIDLVKTGKLDPNATKAYAQAWSNQMIMASRQARDRAFDYINKLKGQNQASPDAYKELEQAVTDAYSRQVEQYSKDQEGTAVTYANIFATYANDTMEMNTKRVDRAIQLMGLYPKEIVQGILSGGPVAEQLKKNYPIIYGIVTQQNSIISNNLDDVDSAVSIQVELGKVEKVVDAFKTATSSNANGADTSAQVSAVVTNPDANPQHVKAAIEKTMFEAENVLTNKAELNETDVQVISTAFATQVLTAGHKNMFERKYKEWGSTIKDKLSDEDQNVISKTISDNTNRSLADVQTILSQINKKYNKKYLMGVSTTGQIMLVADTSNVEAAPEGVDFNAVDSVANDEFRNKANPLFRIAVLARSMMTDESVRDIAVEYALATNADQPVKPWYDNTPVVPTATSNSAGNLTEADMAISMTSSEATKNVEPRPTSTAFTGAYERTIWDSKYGKTHNKDGTPKTTTKSRSVATKSSSVANTSSEYYMTPDEAFEKFNVPKEVRKSFLATAKARGADPVLLADRYARLSKKEQEKLIADVKAGK